MAFFIQYYKTRRSHSPKNKCVSTSRNRTPMKSFLKSNLSISILQEKPEKLTIFIIEQDGGYFIKCIPYNILGSSV